MKPTLLDKLEKRIGHFAIPHLSLIIIFGQLAILGMFQIGRLNLYDIAFIPARVLDGEIWRIFTFLFTPPDTHLIFMAFALYIFHMMSAALEEVWGLFKYNLYIFIGYFATVVLAFAVPETVGTNAFILTSVFLAFAYLNPDFEFLLFFILPIKVKWLAMLTWAIYFLSFAFGGWGSKLYVVAACTNFAIFFAREIIQNTKARKRRIEYEKEKVAAADEPFHACTECGITDKTHPRMDFRCRGDDEYCIECLAKLKQN